MLFRPWIVAAIAREKMQHGLIWTAMGRNAHFSFVTPNRRANFSVAMRVWVMQSLSFLMLFYLDFAEGCRVPPHDSHRVR